MSPVAYFRATLALPLIAPFFLFPFGWIGVIPMMGLMFAGVQYIVFAAVMFYWIGRLTRAQSIQALSLAAPLLFVPFLAAGLLVYFLAEYLGGSTEPPMYYLNSIPMFTLYALVIGYIYVVLANVIFYLLSCIAWVTRARQ